MYGLWLAVALSQPIDSQSADYSPAAERRTAIIQERATRAKALRQKRIEQRTYTDQRPTVGASPLSAVTLPPPIIIPPNPDRDVDVLVVP